MSDSTPLLSMAELDTKRRWFRRASMHEFEPCEAERLYATARAAYDPTGRLWSERAREAEVHAAERSLTARALGDTVVELQARCETMRKALAPFAALADHNDETDEAAVASYLRTPSGEYLTFGDLRRARVALQEQRPPECKEPEGGHCSHLKETNPTDMSGERYECAVCGRSYFLDYDEMR